MSAPDPTALLAAGHAALDAAARVTVPGFRADLTVTDKAAAGALYDPVTQADRDAERAMVQALRARFPAHRIIGEEHGTLGPARAPYTWILDPIDGTRSYMTGLPTWGTLLACRGPDGLVLGLMDQPILGERFVGTPGGATLGDRPLRARATEDVAHAVLYATTPDMFDRDELSAFERLAARVRLRRFGGDCYAYAMLAAGHIDLVVEAGLAPYDIAALVPILRGAGAVVTTWDGGPPDDGGRILAAATPALHARAQAVLLGRDAPAS